jgi:hypothetical protein
VNRRFRITLKISNENQFHPKGAIAMQKALEIGMSGDHDPGLRHHSASEQALSHAAAKLSVLLSPAGKSRTIKNLARFAPPKSLRNNWAFRIISQHGFSPAFQRVLEACYAGRGMKSS